MPPSPPPLWETLKVELEMYTSWVRLVKATSTRWTDHKLLAMDHLIEKFRLYCVYWNNIISTTTNFKEKATLEGKFNKLLDAKDACRWCTDILVETKKFSLITQKSDINIINIFDLVESAKNSYEHLFRKLSKKHNLVFQLPILKMVINAIELYDEDGDELYEDQEVNYYLH